MKNKIIVGTILLVLILSITSSLYTVEAFTGDIDPKNYITMPNIIHIKNKIGTGTATLSTEATGYTMSYQKVDITDTQNTNIEAKTKEYNNYMTTTQDEINKKSADLKTLQQEYEQLQQQSPEKADEIATAKGKYDTALSQYNAFVQQAKAKAQKLYDEYLQLIPDFTASWKETTNTENNIQLDFSSHQGETINFILYIKITNGQNTYYEFGKYSAKTTSSGEDDTPNEGDTPPVEGDGETTDFTKAKFTLKKAEVSKAILEITGVTPKAHCSYALIVKPNNSKPDIENSELLDLSYDDSKKMFKVINSEKLTKYVELNQDLYMSIVEDQGSNKKVIVAYGKKVERYAESKYSDVFHATFVANSATQIVTNFTHAKDNNRKMQVKIGKITDQSILQKIKNKDSSGFVNLLNFAKTNSGIYNKTLNADRDDSYAIEYNAGESSSAGVKTGNEIINLKNIEDKTYYYLYVKTDDENGKYISNEAVTLAFLYSYIVLYLHPKLYLIVI